ncbi:hypothetical protein PNOK_0371000 [Pyrrhoderma noxium]|uniref:Uncharacterized protein n=1 Tax=Pyrrhoderma noxium TaxID=2282107 RepID=A0A286UNA9_9AGAM|nr:hypothetical protein PNOK_0371000 [Pyrrhoderma noxium]
MYLTSSLPQPASIPYSLPNIKECPQKSKTRSFSLLPEIDLDNERERIQDILIAYLLRIKVVHEFIAYQR